jgi:hypothetical protein
MGSKKKSMILGYTRAGHEVLLPTQRSPDEEDFVGWTHGDHIDASRILKEHGEREKDLEAGSWCRRWAKVHRALRKAARKVRVRGAAEISINVRGPR